MNNTRKALFVERKYTFGFRRRGTLETCPTRSKFFHFNAVFRKDVASNRLALPLVELATIAFFLFCVGCILLDEISRSEEFHFGGSSGGQMPHFMQFSVATRELCTLHCVLLNCNGTKCTGNALSIPAVASSQPQLRRNKLPTGCYFFSFLAELL